MSEYIVCVDDLEESYYKCTDIKPETVFGHRLREQIVRCRDCKHYDPHPTDDGVCFLPDGDGGFAYWEVEPDGFCAWSKRREP